MCAFCIATTVGTGSSSSLANPPAAISTNNQQVVTTRRSSDGTRYRPTVLESQQICVQRSTEGNQDCIIQCNNSFPLSDDLVTVHQVFTQGRTTDVNDINMEQDGEAQGKNINPLTVLRHLITCIFCIYNVLLQVM